MMAQEMPVSTPREWLDGVNQVLSDTFGCRIPQKRMHQLVRALCRLATQAGEIDCGPLCRRIIERTATDLELEELLAQLIPGETYFYRDPPCMEALEHHLLPQLIQERREARRLNIWSAGCSTGEEPITLAMMLHARRAELAGWQISILATDLRTKSLEAAKRGLYRDWSFRGCPPELKTRFFERQPSGEYRIQPEIMAMVNYQKINLAHALFPAGRGAFDLIVCRNVMIYLEPARIEALLNRFNDCLCEGGWLILSAAEMQPLTAHPFECVHVGRAMFYRKKVRTEETAEPGWRGFEAGRGR